MAAGSIINLDWLQAGVDLKYILMTTANKISSSEECEKIKNLGYATAKHVTIYGEHFEITSDPFPEDEGIAVHAISHGSSTARVLQLPVSILVGLKDLLPKNNETS